ncbi:hypothetical protein GYB71_14555 [Sinorhizobium medicae]|nr:hypothetical protein [Sinorhizobium medicae]
MFSRVLPGQISHLGIRAEIYGEVREWNFGSFLDGQYEPVGIPGDPRDFLGGFRGQMGMRSTIVGSASVERGLGAALVDQIAAFASDLYNRQINYEPVPNRLGRQANSNSAAAYVMRMLGIDPNSLSYQGNPVGLNVDLSDRRFGLPSPGFYSGRAHADYLDWQYGDAVPTPAPRPTDLAPSVTSPVPQPSGVQQPPILSPINYVPGAPIGVSQTPATPITAPSAVFPNAPVSAPTVSAPPNPVAPSSLVNIIDQNPQKPSSLNPNKSQKSTKSGKQGGGTNRNSDRGGSRSGDHYGGVDRNGGFGGSKSTSGGISSKNSGSGGKSGGSSPKDKGSKSTGKSGGGWGNGNSPGDTARGNGFGGSGPSVGKDPGGRSFQHEGKRDNNQKSKSTGGFGGLSVPVLLDLTGNGLAVDPLSSSSFFVDLDGSGYLHRMASAGAGTGMLVLDIGGDGKISDASEFVFTEWDKSATGDLEAVRNVFDTNGNGTLDAGDARWSEFKVLVDGTMVTLDSLGIASIDLTPRGSGQNFADGSAILGTTSYTRTDGSTGTVGDAALAVDGNGYLIRRSSETSADGSTTEDVFGYSPDGRLAFRNLITRSADGQSTFTQFDDDGNGTFDRSQRIEVTTDAGGNRHRVVSNFNADGSLRDRTTTTTGAGGRTVTTTIDQDGDGTADQSEIFTTNADGSTTTVTRALAPDGSLLGEVKVAGSADGLSKTTSTDENGDGGYDSVISDVTTINSEGERVRTVDTRNADGSLRDRSTTTTAADGRSRSIFSDFDGDGVTDERQEVRISAGEDGSTTTDIAAYSSDDALLGREETTASADGKRTTTRSDLDGDGTVDRTMTIAMVSQADGASTQTETATSADGTLLSRTVTSRSADGKLVTTEADANGDGAVERLTKITVGGDGATTEEIAETHPNGTAAGRSVKLTAADGLSWIRTTDIDGNGATDRTESSTTTINADGSRTETAAIRSGNGSLIGQSVTTTSSDSLSQTVQQDVTGDGAADLIASDRIALNADGTRTETIDTRSGNGTLLGSTVKTVSAERKTTTVAIDADGDGTIDLQTVSVMASDGSAVVTERATASNGALLAQSKSTASRDGLKQVLLTDADGDGTFEHEAATETTLGADGSRTVTSTLRAGNGTLIERTVSKTSDDGFAASVETDANGDGIVDLRASETKRINADGSVTVTVKNQQGTSIVGSTETATSGNGLTRTIRTDADGNGTVDTTATSTRVLQANGSITDTVTVTSGSGATLSRTVTTSSADGRSLSTAADIDGDLKDDVTNVTLVNADGSATSTASTFASAKLQSRSTATTSANGLVTKSETDANGDGVADRAVETATVLNASGGRTVTVREFGAHGAVKSKTVVETSANGLSETTQWSATGDKVTRSRTMTATVNADGSTGSAESYFKAGGALESKIVSATSADRKTTTVAGDMDGNGVIDRKAVSTVNADGSTTTVLSDLGSDGVKVVGRKTVTASGNGLKTTSDYDTDGNGALDTRFTSSTAFNGNGSRTETVTRQDGALKTQEKAVTEISADELSITRKWDLNGDGSFERSRTDVTKRNADGSVTRKVSELSGTTSTRQAETTTSANGLSVTHRWDLDGNGSYDQSSTDTTVLNGNGSVTRSVTSKKADGSQIARSVETRSADGRSVTVTEDRTALGLASRALVSSKTTLADGSVVETLSILDAAKKLAEKQTTTASADSREISIVRDSDGDGKTDQTETYTRFVDGSQSTVITGYSKSGTKLDGTTITTSADGRTTTTSWDLDGNGTTDRLRRTVLTANADGSENTVSTDTTAAGAIRSKTAAKVSADGRSELVSRDLNGDGLTDSTETTVRDLSGAAVTTIVNNAEARKTSYLIDSDVAWKEAIAAKSEIAVTADGNGRTMRSDFDGNGTYEYAEMAATQIDGSVLSTITETDSKGAVIARGTRIESADGRTVKLEKDADNDGDRDRTQTAVTHLDGAVTLTTVEWTSATSIKETVTESFNATGKLTRRLTTDAAGKRTQELLLLADGTMTDSVYDGASGKTLSVTRLSKDGVPVTATFYDPLGAEKWKEATQTFDAAGELIKQVQSNDDGSRQTDTFDVAKKQSWAQQTDVNDKAGALTQRSYLNDDKTRVTTFYDVAKAKPWSSAVQYFDAAGKMTKQVQTNDDGSKQTDTFDVAKKQSWAQQTDLNDKAGALTQRSYLNDDKTRTTTLYDPAKAKSWSTVTQYFDAAGKLSKQEQVNDNGTKVTDWFDLTDAQTWDRQTYFYDKAGVRTQRSWVYDDKTKTNIYYDTTKTKGYSSLTQYLDVAGKLTRQDEVKDDGTRRIDWYDVPKAQTWTQQTDLFDKAGARTQRSFLYDDGSKSNTFYDVAKRQAYSSLTDYLDKAGKLTKRHQTLDNGTKQTDWFDIAKTQAWTQQTYSYDAAGATTKKTWLNDNGTKNIIFYDVAKAKTYSSLTQYLDAAGKLTKQVQINDNGTKQTDWYDLADTKAWWQQTDWNDASGALTQRSYLDDSKTRVTTKYDPGKTQKWTTIVQNFDAAGKMTTQVQSNDDGSKETTTYDVANAEKWSQLSDVTDTAGKLVERSQLNDDKSRTIITDDPSGAHRTTKHFNAAGQLVESSDLSGGVLKTTYYDFDNSKSWAHWTHGLMIPRPLAPLTFQSTTWDNGKVTSGKPPVLLDLNGDDHIDLRPFNPLATNGPAFDWDGDGTRDATAWFGPEDGILAIDLAANGASGSDGLIDQERELAFASWAEGGGVASDMEGLRLVFDTNRDNALDAQDARWNEFRVWQDHNQNGVTDTGELMTMSEAGIRLVNLLPSTDGAKAFDDGSVITGTSSMTMTDGTTRLVADTTLAFRPSSLNQVA